MQAAACEDRPPARPPEELEAIFRKHHAAVFRAAYRVTGNAMDAEDVLQTIFARLLRRQRSGAGGAISSGAGVPSPISSDAGAPTPISLGAGGPTPISLGAGAPTPAWSPAGGELDLSETAAGYLHRAAVNAALDLLRSRKRARAVALGEVEDALVDETQADPDRRSRNRELARRLRNALALLTPRQSEVFSLRYLEGLGNLEIARLLDTSQTSIAVILHRARHRLQRELGSLEGEPS